jgi:hypothetical protein
MSVRSHLLVLSSVLVGLLPTAPGVSAQKPSLDHDDYDRWNRIQGDRLSNDGRWLAFTLVPGDGDPVLQVRGTDGGASMTVQRASGPRFSADSRWVVATVPPAHTVIDSMRRAEVDRDDLPGDSLILVDLEGFSGSGFDAEAATTRMGEIHSFGLSEEGAFLAIHLPAPNDEGSEPDRDDTPGDDEEEEARDRGRVGTPLLLRDLSSGREFRFKEVSSFAFTDDGSHLFLTRTTADGDGDGVVRIATGSGEAIDVVSGPGRYARLSVQPDGHRAVFLTDRDAADEDAGTMAVYVADDARAGRVVAQASTPGMPSGWGVSSEESPSLSPSGTRVFFGARMPSIPVDPELEDQLDDEVVRVDVWSWTDDRLQPMQLLQLEADTGRAYLSLVPFEGGTVVPLATPDVPSVRLVEDGDGDVALGSSDLPYRTLVSWDARYSDAYVVDLAGGRATMVGEKLRGTARISPEGRWVYWWDGDRRGWFARSSAGGDEFSLTAGVPHPVHNELDDHPDAPPAYGEAGWTAGDAAFLVYDRHDLWAVDPTRPGSPRAVTDGVGRRDGLRFRLVDTDPDEAAVPTTTPVLLRAFDLYTKESGLYRDRLDGSAPPLRLRMDEAQLSSPRKARDADRFLFTRQTFEDFPDLWVSGPDFDDAMKLSEANPQQDASSTSQRASIRPVSGP